jgi:hypothetical protein
MSSSTSSCCCVQNSVTVLDVLAFKARLQYELLLRSEQCHRLEVLQAKVVASLLAVCVVVQSYVAHCVLIVDVSGTMQVL